MYYLCITITPSYTKSGLRLNRGLFMNNERNQMGMNNNYSLKEDSLVFIFMRGRP